MHKQSTNKIWLHSIYPTLSRSWSWPWVYKEETWKVEKRTLCWARKAIIISRLLHLLTWFSFLPTGTEIPGYITNQILSEYLDIYYVQSSTDPAKNWGKLHERRQSREEVTQGAGSTAQWPDSTSQVWWHRPVIPALQRLMQEDHEFSAPWTSLFYRAEQDPFSERERKKGREGKKEKKKKRRKDLPLQ